MTTPSSISPAARKDAGPTVGKGAASGGAGALPAAGDSYTSSALATDVFTITVSAAVTTALTSNKVPARVVAAVLRAQARVVEAMEPEPSFRAYRPRRPTMRERAGRPVPAWLCKAVEQEAKS